MSRIGLALSVLTATAAIGAAAETGLATGPHDLRAFAEIESKHYDQGVVWVDDATAHYGVQGRLYTVGLQLDAWTALGQDTGASPNKVSGLETTQLRARLDTLIAIDFDRGIPFLQILPHWEGILYPNQRPSAINNDQNYFGADVWVAPPFKGFEGFEFGGGLDRNVDRTLHSFRGFVGARQFFQAAPLDLALSQVFTFGNGAYWNQLSGIDDSQIGVGEFNADLTLPLPWRGWWAQAGAKVFYWLDNDQRDYNRDAGIDNGGFIVSVGITWLRERTN
jgi:hypothetical protein